MPYVMNLQEFIGNVMIPFTIVVGGICMAIIAIEVIIATLINTLMDEGGDP